VQQLAARLVDVVHERAAAAAAARSLMVRRRSHSTCSCTRRESGAALGQLVEAQITGLAGSNRL
jgi:hypothetical protein